MSVKITIDKTPGLQKALKDLGSARVMVGIPAAKATRQPEPGETETLNNAEIGYIMENGAPEANIPARPFLMPGIDSAKDDIVRRLKAAGQAALDGKPEVVDRGLNAVGLVAMNAVQQKITDGPFVPLAEATLARRRARGRTGTKPLLDSGQLRRAVNYVIRRLGGK